MVSQGCLLPSQQSSSYIVVVIVLVPRRCRHFWEVVFRIMSTRCVVFAENIVFRFVLYCIEFGVYRKNSRKGDGGLMKGQERNDYC